MVPPWTAQKQRRQPQDPATAGRGQQEPDGTAVKRAEVTPVPGETLCCRRRLPRPDKVAADVPIAINIRGEISR